MAQYVITRTGAGSTLKPKNPNIPKTRGPHRAQERQQDVAAIESEVDKAVSYSWVSLDNDVPPTSPVWRPGSSMMPTPGGHASPQLIIRTKAPKPSIAVSSRHASHRASYGFSVQGFENLNSESMKLVTPSEIVIGTHPLFRVLDCCHSSTRVLRPTDRTQRLALRNHQSLDDPSVR